MCLGPSVALNGNRVFYCRIDEIFVGCARDLTTYMDDLKRLTTIKQRRFVYNSSG